jgi:hypothetical protein
VQVDTDPRQRQALADTLGARLDRVARRLAARRTPSYGWAIPLDTLLSHVISLNATHVGRFDRVRMATPLSPPGMFLPGRAVAGPIGLRAPSAPETSQPSSPRTDDAVKSQAGHKLPWDVEHRLRQVIGPGAEEMRVHTGEASDGIARSHEADAVTMGRDVHFRRSRYRPRDVRGFGLLVHEATHVLAFLQPGSAWRRATGAGVAAEEHDALSREGGWSSRPPAPPPAAPAGRLPRSDAGRAQPSPTNPAARAMAAPASRDAPTSRVETLDVAALRKDIMHDLMGQLRNEFERGG